jgi:hypothetical protein
MHAQVHMCAHAHTHTFIKNNLHLLLNTRKFTTYKQLFLCFHFISECWNVYISYYCGIQRYEFRLNLEQNYEHSAYILQHIKKSAQKKITEVGNWTLVIQATTSCICDWAPCHEYVLRSGANKQKILAFLTTVCQTRREQTQISKCPSFYRLERCIEAHNLNTS